MKPRTLIAAAALVAAGCSSHTLTQPEPTTTPEPPPHTVTDVETANANIAEVFRYFATTTTTPPGPNPKPTQTPPPTSTSDRWQMLAQCETGGNWQTNTGNGYGGGLQFAHTPSWSTWRAYGGEDYAPHPWQATQDQQIAVAKNVLASAGWNAWPGCSSRLGYR